MSAVDSSGPAVRSPGLGIEANGINVIDESERKGTPAQLFWPWCAANVSVLGVSYGSFVLGFGHVAFGVPLRGSLPAVFAVGALGALCFGGLGLLVGSRARRMETVTGLMNVVMMPMFVLSGIFWAERWFPAPEGPAMVFRHGDHPFTPVLACDRCGRPLSGTEVLIEPHATRSSASTVPQP